MNTLIFHTFVTHFLPLPPTKTMPVTISVWFKICYERLHEIKFGTCITWPDTKVSAIGIDTMDQRILLVLVILTHCMILNTTGMNVPGNWKGCCNHTHYIYEMGYCDLLVKILQVWKDKIRSIFNVDTGLLCHLISTEVDCKSLVSRQIYVSSNAWLDKYLRIYEHLMVAKHWHWLLCILCSIQKVKWPKRMYMLMKTFWRWKRRFICKISPDSAILLINKDPDMQGEQDNIDGNKTKIL